MARRKEIVDWQDKAFKRLDEEVKFYKRLLFFAVISIFSMLAAFVAVILKYHAGS